MPGMRAALLDHISTTQKTRSTEKRQAGAASVRHGREAGKTRVE
jgi:hypothetical protein